MPGVEVRGRVAPRWGDDAVSVGCSASSYGGSNAPRSAVTARHRPNYGTGFSRSGNTPALHRAPLGEESPLRDPVPILGLADERRMSDSGVPLTPLSAGPGPSAPRRGFVIWSPWTPRPLGGPSERQVSDDRGPTEAYSNIKALGMRFSASCVRNGGCEGG